MAWTTPMTTVAGQIITASNWNTHIRDNERYLKGLDGAPTIESGLVIDNTDGDEYLKLPLLTTAEAGTVLDAEGKVAFDETLHKLKYYDDAGIETVLNVSDVDDTPVDSATTDPISSNWAYDHVAAADPHPGYALESLADAAGDIFYASADNTWARLAIGNDGEFLKVDTNVPAWTSSISAVYAMGDVLLKSADTPGGNPDADYTKKKEITIPDGGTFRIKFDLKGYSALAGIYGRIYRNGVAVGTEQSDITNDFVTKSEDIAGWSSGDLCQLYIKYITASSPSAGWRNFRIYAASQKSDWVVNLDN